LIFKTFKQHQSQVLAMHVKHIGTKCWTNRQYATIAPYTF